MPPVRFDLWWNETSHKTFKVDSEQLVCEVVSEIREQLADDLPESDQRSHIIEYALFKNGGGKREPLLAHQRTFSQLHVVEGDTLYLANLEAPWWGNPQRSTSARTARPSAATLGRCLLHLGGSVVEVPPEGLELNRGYLLSTLPARVVVREKAKSLAGLKSRLHAVSRQQHCAILRRDGCWLLCAHKDTYVNGLAFAAGVTTRLAGSTTIVLGREGWLVEVRLVSS